MKAVSVIIPTYNRAALLKKAIDSVLGQTCRDFELIVVDDGSSDDTKAIVSGYKGRLRYVFQDNRGPSAARNRGIREAQANFIAFLDSDDWWRSDKLAIQLRAMQEHKDYLISHTQEIWYRHGELLNQKKKHAKSGGDIFKQSLALCAVSMSTAMVNRKLFDAVGVFDETLPCCEDYDFWLRVSARYQFFLVDEPLTLKDGGRPDQVSSRFARRMDQHRIYSMRKLLEGNGVRREQRCLLIEELGRRCSIYGQGCIKYGRNEEGEQYLRLAQEYRK